MIKNYIQVVARTGPIYGFTDPFGHPLWMPHYYFQVRVYNYAGETMHFFEDPQQVNEAVAKFAALLQRLNQEVEILPLKEIQTLCIREYAHG